MLGLIANSQPESKSYPKHSHWTRILAYLARYKNYPPSQVMLGLVANSYQNKTKSYQHSRYWRFLLAHIVNCKNYQKKILPGLNASAFFSKNHCYRYLTGYFDSHRS